MSSTIANASTGQLGDGPHDLHGRAEAERLADGVGDRARDRDDERAHEQDHDADQRDGELHGLELQERAALGDLVDAVHRPGERADVAGGRPDRENDARDEREAGGGRLDEAGQDRLDQREGVRGGEAAQQVEDRRHRLLPLPEHPEQRDDRDERGEQRQHRVVRQRRRDVCALVRAELAHGLPEDVLPGGLLDLRRGVGLARVVLVGTVLDRAGRVASCHWCLRAVCGSGPRPPRVARPGGSA